MFAVVLGDEYPEIVNRLKTLYTDSHELSPSVFLVVTQDTNRQIADRIGIEETTPGVVFTLSGKMAGVTADETYEWLARHLGQPA
ncbi:MAG: hypothetical protein OXN24_00820 [Candidatus Dadabacteria bacterium]|nr:hypothetical protein [Candidatus Dadabacteria bacterium]MDE0403982.1 hypothetical protein [Nitrospira sp.]